jgi:glutathione synthase/RimK-type ligase-like ATP-grasp enzyme
VSVLILAPTTDEHATAVGAGITGQGGHVDIVDVAAFPERAALTMRFDGCGGCRRSIITLAERSIDLDTVGAVWWRRPHWPAVAPGMVRPSHRAFAANETQEALGGLWQALDAGWINDPAADDRAARKGYQLAVAQEVGLTIPRTLMTNDPDDAAMFVDALGYRNVVYKTFSSTQDEWRETRVLRAEELPLLHLVRHAPVIFQEFVPAVHDLRVTVIGDDVFAAAIHSQESDYPVDSRVDISNVKVEPVALPTDISAMALALTRRLGLVYGAIDLRLTPDGRHVFLEINPSGQFLYIEAATGMPIAAAMAAALVAADRRHVPTSTAGPRRPAALGRRPSAPQPGSSV